MARRAVVFAALIIVAAGGDTVVSVPKPALFPLPQKPVLDGMARVSYSAKGLQGRGWAAEYETYAGLSPYVVLGAMFSVGHDNVFTTRTSFTFREA